MIITLKDGSKKEYAEAKSVYEIALDISEGLARAACAGEINGEVVDLRTVVDKDCELNILTANDEKGLAALRHTTSHVLAEAVKNLYPDAKLAIGPSIDTGFYYDFDHESFSREELDALEKEMKKIIKKGAKIERYTLPRAEAIKFMEEKGESYKVELIQDLPEDAEISFYSQGDFVDLCAGPHLMSTKNIKAFKLISSSGAYWRGNEKNKMFSRIYGTAFGKKDELNVYLEQLEEAKKRDHNKLGREMELFTTVDVIGQGLPLIMPKGVIMMKELQRWIEDLEDNEWGYVRTKTPLMAKSDLYKISGHWDHYKDGMFVLGDEEKDKEVFALRPMTCPFQYYVYKASQHSYRELPIRYGETSTLFRNEDSGEMHGLTRVRQFTISEGHLIVRPDQMVEEFKGCLALAKHCLETLGVEEDVTYHLSKWDPENKEKYICQIKKLANKYKKIPLVSIERDFTDVGIDSVYFDGYTNARTAVRHLIDCGCKKICHIAGTKEMEIVRERVKGYKSCMKENHLFLDEEKMIVHGDYSHQSGYTAMKQLMMQVPDLDGIFCGNDQMAIGVLKFLKENGKRVPEDVKVIGYDDVFIASVVEPALSSIHVRKRHAGIESARMLFRRIENPDEENIKPIGIKMDAKLVVRQSTVSSASEDWNLVDW